MYTQIGKKWGDVINCQCHISIPFISLHSGTQLDYGTSPSTSIDTVDIQLNCFLFAIKKINRQFCMATAMFDSCGVPIITRSIHIC